MLRLAGWILGGVLLLPLQAGADCMPDCSHELCDPIVAGEEPWALVEAEPVGQGQWAVTEVHGGPLASEIESGDLFEREVPHGTDRLLLVVTRFGVEGALPIDDGGQVHCFDALGEASLEAAIQAAFSSDCYTAAADAGLTGGPCDDVVERVTCSTGGSGLPWLGGVAALLGLGAGARRRNDLPRG